MNFRERETKEDQERRQAIKDFYREYRKAQKKRCLRMHSHFSIYDDGIIEIWEYEGERRIRTVCKAKEESETQCYKRATEEIKSYIAR